MYQWMETKERLQFSPNGTQNWIQQMGVAGQGTYGLAVAVDALGQPTVLVTTSGDLSSGNFNWGFNWIV